MENYEKKYKNALEWARQVMNGKTGFIRDEVLDVFPELKDNDEIIKREIIKYIKTGTYHKDWIAWLEKQESVEEIVARCKKSWYNEGKIAGMAEGLTDDEKYQQGWHDAVEQGKRLENYDWYERGKADAIEDTCNWLSQQGDMLEDCFSDVNDFVDLYKEAVRGGEKPQGKSALEAIKEKPVDNANKIEQKFHKDDWIVWENQYYKVNYNGFGYELVDQNGLKTSLEYGTVDENAHLWDITKDAKDGDVLVCEDFGYISLMLFKSFSNGRISLYCWHNSQTNNFHINTDTALRKDANIFPATKEQCDTLMKAMTDAGYEWDAEKKELKKIELKKVEPKFKVGDVIEFTGYGHTIYTIQEIHGTSHYTNSDGQSMEMSYTDANFNLVEQKPTDEEIKELLQTEYENGRADAIAEIQKGLSEDDEEEFQITIDTLVEAGQRDSAHWLKSLKQRII